MYFIWMSDSVFPSSSFKLRTFTRSCNISCVNQLVFIFGDRWPSAIVVRNFGHLPTNNKRLALRTSYNWNFLKLRSKVVPIAYILKYLIVYLTCNANANANGNDHFGFVKGFSIIRTHIFPKKMKIAKQVDSNWKPAR